MRPLSTLTVSSLHRDCYRDTPTVSAAKRSERSVRLPRTLALSVLSRKTTRRTGRIANKRSNGFVEFPMKR